MKAELWPNRMGYDVDDNEEVWQLKNGLAVRIFTEDCKIRFLFIPDPCLDPVVAVIRCQKDGKTQC